MTEIAVIKQYISNIIGKYEAYLKPVGKLILALITLITINAKLTPYPKVNNFGVVMIAALMCSFMPLNFILLIGAVFIILHMYALSLESAAVVLVFFLVLFLLYFRLAPKDTIAVILTPILSGLGIPYVMPVAMGLAGGPSSAVSIGVGVIVNSVLKSIMSSSEELNAMETDDMASRLKFIIDSILDNKTMILLVVAFAITVFVVYFIKQLPIDYSWSIAVIAGAIVDAIVLLIGALSTDASVSVIGLFIGTILAIVVGIFIQLLMFNVDYSRTEKVQFQDDEYYYYVKAIPKNTGSLAKKATKRAPQSAHNPTRAQQPHPANKRPVQQQRPVQQRPASQQQVVRQVNSQTQPMRNRNLEN